MFQQFISLLNDTINSYQRSKKFLLKLITLNNKLENLKIAQLPKLITDEEKWVVNISNNQIPDNVSDILSLDGKFNYNHTKKRCLLIKLSLILNTIYIIFQL